MWGLPLFWKPWRLEPKHTACTTLQSQAGKPSPGTYVLHYSPHPAPCMLPISCGLRAGWGGAPESPLPWSQSTNFHCVTWNH